MLQTLQQIWAPAVMERLTLLVNHVLASERAATARLLPHAGKALRLELTDWPALLPPLPSLLWRVTAAGLLEWCGAEPMDQPELSLRAAADNPALLAVRLLGGEMPPVDVVGDAQFATDVNWLMQNLRWDWAADLERAFPQPLAAALHRAGRAVADGLRSALQSAESLKNRWRAR